MSTQLRLIVLATAALASGCGAATASTVTTHAHQPPPATSGVTTAGATTSTSVVPPRCTVGQLTVRQTSSNGAAGSVGLTYAFTNISATACSLHGYPGMQMLAAGGTALPTTVLRAPSVVVPSVVEHTVVLAPNAIASFYAGYSDVSAGSCPRAARLELTPPNAYDHLTIASSISPCRGRINVSPVFAGAPKI